MIRGKVLEASGLLGGTVQLAKRDQLTEQRRDPAAARQRDDLPAGLAGLSSYGRLIVLN